MQCTNQINVTSVNVCLKTRYETVNLHSAMYKIQKIYWDIQCITFINLQLLYIAYITQCKTNVQLHLSYTDFKNHQCVISVGLAYSHQLSNTDGEGNHAKRSAGLQTGLATPRQEERAKWRSEGRTITTKPMVAENGSLMKHTNLMKKLLNNADGSKNWW